MREQPTTADTNRGAPALAAGGRPESPDATSLRHLTPSDAKGAAFTAIALVVTAAGVLCALQRTWPAWIAGELLLAAALVQWFVLLHECGHGTLYRTRAFNALVGRLAGFFALIPYAVWKRVHHRHHKWTGWQDLDPTTAALVPRPLGRVERFAANLCWRWWIPLFVTLYRLNNFWNLPRLLRLFPVRAIRRALGTSLAVSAALYIALVIVLGPVRVIEVAGVALVLAFVVEDVLIISQHTHIPMHLSGGRRVPAFPAPEQEPFTRSLRLPAAVSWMALHFDAHELHHMYPSVPGYRLRDVPYSPSNEVAWWRWIPAARAVPGAVLLFQNRNDTGLEI